MIVFDLRCGGGHVFEAWFGSSAAWNDQRAAGQVRCPVCDDPAVEKALMAPAIAAKGNSRPERSPADVKAVLKALAAMQAKALEGSTWVGGGFADRARAMHDGDEPHAVIHGLATITEAKALFDDRVPVAPLLLPVLPPDTAN